MEKKNYQKPCVNVIQVVEACNILAGSGEPQILIDKDKTINSGYVDAKGSANSGLWNDDETEE